MQYIILLMLIKWCSFIYISLLNIFLQTVLSKTQQLLVLCCWSLDWQNTYFGVKWLLIMYLNTRQKKNPLQKGHSAYGSMPNVTKIIEKYSKWDFPSKNFPCGSNVGFRKAGLWSSILELQGFLKTIVLSLQHG